MMEPLVSCIVPVYNAAAWVAEAIESIRAQTWPDLEIIVVDDGSTDDSAEIARRSAPDARHLRQRNQGPAAARNAGLAAARGEFVTFLDADDLWAPEKIERQVAQFEAHPGLEVCLTKFQNFWVEELADEALRWRDHPLSQPMTGFAPPTLLARTTVFDRVGLFDPARRHGENMDWFLRAVDLGVSIHLLPEPLVRRRIHPANMTLLEEKASRDAFLRFIKAMLDRKRRGKGARGSRFEEIVSTGDGVKEGPRTPPAPLVSCIVPVYNGERFLAEAIDSILAQDWRNLEVIVVDDGSSDGTARAARAYGERVRYLRQENAGPAAARNRGIDNAGGEFIAFLDADDTWVRDKIPAQMARFEADPDLGICLCHIRNVWEREMAEEEKRLEGHRRTKPVPGYATVALMARASVFQQVGPFDTRFGHADDTDWFVRARAAGVKTTILPDVLVNRRMHRGNRSRRRAAASREEYLKLVKAALDRKRTGPGDPAD